jgi:hypothetical protein
MASFDLSIDIGRPPIDVYEAFVDLTQHALAWDKKLHSIQRGGGPFGVGMSYKTERKVKGRMKDGTIRVLGQDPRESIDWEAECDGVTSTYTTRFERVEGGSRLSVTGQAAGTPLATSSVKRYWEKQLPRIKADLEGTGG